MRIDLEDPQPNLLEKAARTIREGGVVLYPSDTIYGLGCDPFQALALDRLFHIKGRPENRGVLVLIPDLGWIGQLASSVPRAADSILDRFWPGPLTVLLKARPSLPAGLTGREGKIGVRRPALPYLEDWMRLIPGPIVSTSANRSGEPAPATLEELRRLFADRVDLFLESGEAALAAPSTVLDLTEEPFRIVREGALGPSLRKFLARFSRRGP
jgi:L-threonylcarbamoyladenylate synthase